VGALPKRRISHSRQAHRRARHHIALPALTRCPDCGAMHVVHHVCDSCGRYRGRQAIIIRERPERTEAS
jgi:large subunit ribosomal protein L32